MQFARYRCEQLQDVSIDTVCKNKKYSFSLNDMWMKIIAKNRKCMSYKRKRKEK